MASWSWDLVEKVMLIVEPSYMYPCMRLRSLMAVSVDSNVTYEVRSSPSRNGFFEQNIFVAFGKRLRTVSSLAERCRRDTNRVGHGCPPRVEPRSASALLLQQPLPPTGTIGPIAPLSFPETTPSLLPHQCSGTTFFSLSSRLFCEYSLAEYTLSCPRFEKDTMSRSVADTPNSSSTWCSERSVSFTRCRSRIATSVDSKLTYEVLLSLGARGFVEQ
mmetsp:Transcript_16264/g.27099  ORF Transcript_16264/g.27099 Transcript_16264/m.27099 type:complete len:217 (-) Transcript_16264:758-1408(-)